MSSGRHDPFPYDVVAALPTGGMSEVTLALRHADRLPVVIKRLNDTHIKDGASFEKFLAEGDLLTLVKHPNVVRRVEIGSRDGIPFLVLEHVAGVDLRDVLNKCVEAGLQIDDQIAIYVAQETLKALAHVHRATSSTGEPLGLVHQDINPANILLGFTGRVCLTDFGIAVAQDLDPLEELATEGKLAFLSPEQVTHDAVDHRADIYATGAVLYEITTLRPPFDLAGGDEQAVLERIAAGQLVPPAKLRKDYPRKLQKVVLKAMARKPSRRYEKAEFMSVELGALLDRGADVPGMMAALLRQLFPDRYQKMAELYRSAGHPMG